MGNEHGKPSPSVAIKLREEKKAADSAEPPANSYAGIQSKDAEGPKVHQSSISPALSNLPPIPQANPKQLAAVDPTERVPALARAAPATPTLKELTNALKFVLDWPSLGANLDLSGPELATIEKDYRGDNTRCKTEMLSRWLENTTKPSWEAIVEAVRLMEADAVADTIQRKYVTSTSTTEDRALATLVQQPMGVVGVSAVTSSNISSGTVASASLIARANLRMIKHKFASVLAPVLTVLQRKGISVPNLRVILAASYVPEDNTEEINPFSFIRNVLGTAQSVSGVFEALMSRGLLSFKNYHVLRPIVDKYAGEISAKLDEYEDEICGYILVTTLQDYLAAELEQNQQAKPDPKLLDEFSLKANVDVADKKMNYVRELWTSLGLHPVDINVATFDGRTALEEASINGHQKVVEILLEAGANPDLQGKDGFFPLHIASQEGYDGIVDLLILAGARVDLQNKDGGTALERASFNGHQKVVELLLAAGANPDLQDKDGLTAQDQASLNGHQKVVELLLGAGANPDLQNKSESMEAFPPGQVR